MERIMMGHLEHQIQRANVRMDELTRRVGHIEMGFIDCESDADVIDALDLDRLVHSVDEVRTNYEHLHKEIVELQQMQRQLSSTVQLQTRLVQSKFERLKAKIGANGTRSVRIDGATASSAALATAAPPATSTPPPALPNLLRDVPTDLHESRFPHY